jgi:hypothetical protein
VDTRGDASTDMIQRPDEVVDDVDFGGLSLRDFAAADASGARQHSHVHAYSAQSVEECTSSPTTPSHLLMCL